MPAPGAPLILDGNCGFSADKALQLTATLLEQGVQVALLEQLDAGTLEAEVDAAGAKGLQLGW